jgi:cysteine-rich repeat protein
MFNLTYFKKSIAFVVLLIALTPLAALAQNYCGDGMLNVEFGEECDDGNFANRDSCSAYCKIEDMDPPEVSSLSIPNEATGISTLTESLTVVFSEPIDEASLTKNATVRFEHAATPLDFDLDLQDDQKTLLITFNQELFSLASHALRLRNIVDLPGNVMEDEYISAFKTAVAIDYTAPTVKVKPPGGTYAFSQNVEFIPYKTAYTGSDENIDLTAKIYYTLDGTDPTTNSALFENSIPIRTNMILKYFAIDDAGNKTEVFTENYNFDCPEHPNAKDVTPYPNCIVLECKTGFVLRSNICVARIGEADPNDYEANAVTAPLFGSDTPMTVSTKPAIFITKEHRGVLPRPIVFKDLERGMTIEFERDTKITTMDGKVFDGYIKPPDNLYLKDFPINFGYSFKSIFEFKAADGRELKFDPPYKIIAPYTEGFNMDEGVTVFTYDPETENYTEYRRLFYNIDLDKKEVSIQADKTIAFFLAQTGKYFNEAVFDDVTNHWAKNYIETLYRKGIVRGRSPGIYAPDEYLTRAEFLKIALEAIDAEIPNIDDIYEIPYRDVPLFAWYIAYVKRARDLGLIQGYANRQFKPEQFITRAEAVKILITAFGFDLECEDTPALKGRRYEDLDTSQWYYPYINFVIQKDIMQGTKKTTILYTFGPASPITRAEMAKLTIKTIELAESMEE